MKFLRNLFLYFSAFVPLFVLLFVKIIVDIANQNLTFNFLNTLNLCLLCSMIILGIFGLFWNTTLSDEKEVIIKVKKSKNITDQYFLQYFSLFVLFAVPLDISYVNEFCIYLIVLVFIGIVYINSGLYYINPLLNILGYKFYDVTFVSQETGKQREAKIFSKQDLLKTNYVVKIKNDNFAFVSRKPNTAELKQNNSKPKKEQSAEKPQQESIEKVSKESIDKTRQENIDKIQQENIDKIQ
jgi:hypothetical protein